MALLHLNQDVALLNARHIPPPIELGPRDQKSLTRQLVYIELRKLADHLPFHDMSSSGIEIILVYSQYGSKSFMVRPEKLNRINCIQWSGVQNSLEIVLIFPLFDHFSSKYSCSRFRRAFEAPSWNVDYKSEIQCQRSFRIFSSKREIHWEPTSRLTLMPKSNLLMFALKLLPWCYQNTRIQENLAPFLQEFSSAFCSVRFGWSGSGCSEWQLLISGSQVRLLHGPPIKSSTYKEINIRYCQVQTQYSLQPPRSPRSSSLFFSLRFLIFQITKGRQNHSNVFFGLPFLGISPIIQTWIQLASATDGLMPKHT